MAMGLLSLAVGGKLTGKEVICLTITITCRCGAHFEILEKSKNTGVFSCPNCGRALPGNASDYVKELLASYANLRAELDRSEFYEVKVSP